LAPRAIRARTTSMWFLAVAASTGVRPDASRCSMGAPATSRRRTCARSPRAAASTSVGEGVGWAVAAVAAKTNKSNEWRRFMWRLCSWVLGCRVHWMPPDRGPGQARRARHDSLFGSSRARQFQNRRPVSGGSGFLGFDVRTLLAWGARGGSGSGSARSGPVHCLKNRLASSTGHDSHSA
jgi:hypothetical protein